MGAMQPSELLSVGQEAPGLLLLEIGMLLFENYREPWKQLVEYMKQGESAIPSNVEPAKAKYTKSGQKIRCLGRVREWSNTISYMKRCVRINC
jgi:hypothetical protein